MGRARAARGADRAQVAPRGVAPASCATRRRLAAFLGTLAGVGLRRLRGELVLGWAAAVVGATGIASALTPEFANRSDFVRGVLPPGFPGAARILALTFGLTLIWLSRSLAGRRRRAWQLAVVLVIGLAVAHLAKGLDVEEASLSLLVLAALFRFRKRFDVPGDPLFVRPLVVTSLTFATTAALLLVLDL